MPKKLPIGIEDFGELIKKEYWFADKSLMIKDFIDSGAKVTLITRPRRWGKTLNMSMFHYFFSSKVYTESTQGTFEKLAISTIDNGKYLKEHQGKYPVIFISFKDIKEKTFDEAMEKLSIQIQEIYRENSTILLKSEKLDNIDKDNLNKFLQRKATKVELENSLKELTYLLHKHYEKKVIVLIDEYDTPLNAAYDRYLDNIVLFMRNFLSAGLKSNPYLEKAMMTGILRISQTSILSGLNNPDVFTLLHKEYSQYFGFSELEVKELLRQIDSESKIELQKIRDWYNGYKVGDITLYNPWSIVKCLARNELQAHWVRTADDSLLEKIISNSDKEVKEKFAKLLQNKSVGGTISEHISFDNLTRNETALWSLLVFAGYLQPSNFVQSGINYNCELRIPNYEVSLLYESIFKEWLENKKFYYSSFINLLLAGKVEEFTHELGSYILQSASVFDVGGDSKRPEQFYHGFMFALVLGLRGTHEITSNRESGLGRYDIMIKPKSINNHIAIILEFKHAKSNENMSTVAKTALQQIDDNKYETELKEQAHITSVLKIGLAFSDKSVQSAFKMQDLTKEEVSELRLSIELFQSGDTYTSEEPDYGKKQQPLMESLTEVNQIQGEDEHVTTEKKHTGEKKRPRSREIGEEDEEENPKKPKLEDINQKVSFTLPEDSPLNSKKLSQKEEKKEQSFASSNKPPPSSKKDS